MPNPERSRQEAARRARRTLRQYCAANRLNRLATLTYAPPFCKDPRQVRADIGVFFRGLRDSLGGKPFPYAWVPEFHGDGERFHVHFAVGRYVPRAKIERAWGHGWVHIKLIGDLPVGSGRLEESRIAAGYLSKYVSKSFLDDHVPRGHRYDVAQGFQPERVRIWGRSMQEATDRASAFMHRGLPVRSWCSSEEEGWEGPPAWWVQWA